MGTFPYFEVEQQSDSLIFYREDGPYAELRVDGMLSLLFDHPGKKRIIGIQIYCWSAILRLIHRRRESGYRRNTPITIEEVIDLCYGLTESTAVFLDLGLDYQLGYERVMSVAKQVLDPIPLVGRWPL